MEEIQQKLLKAAIEGDTPLLVEIHTQNPLILNRVTVGCFNETPLHVAALRGHVEFARKLVSLDSELAQVLDFQGSSPLHLASAKGYIQIVKLLVAAKPEMCKVLDRDGFNPLHLAAIKGKVEVLRELVRKMPQAALPKLNHQQTILHLCVKHFQMDALKLLMEETDDVQILGLVNATDDYGYTILHLAVADKQIQIVKYLASRVDVNAINANGLTALDILSQSRRGVEDWEIGNSLQEAGGLKAADIPLSGNGNRSARPSNMLSIVHDQSRTPLAAQTSNNLRSQTAAATLPSNGSNNPQIPSFLRHDTARSSAQGDQSKHKLNDQGQWLAKKRDALMVVASLLATMAFQAGVNPPGGVWQDDKPVDSQVQGQPVQFQHRAGEAVVAYHYGDSYKYYLRANTIGFVASLSTILFLISGFPFKRKTFMWILMVIMWLSITSMAFSYGYSIVAVTPIKDRDALQRTMLVAIPVWCGVMGLLFLGHTLRLTEKWLTKKGKSMWEPVRNFFRNQSNPKAMEVV
ncbi:hypothetical protein HYC85_027504 [Camellia sinensis]|uniref:PGG domain-containing protein n=1 Tax=Camellia sinensis TaxID=4442 RepID=A0A7J7G7W5_CAMSI|nr:hypothetical protein HYC85_027504 [Camellia sinensis]